MDLNLLKILKIGVFVGDGALFVSASQRFGLFTELS